MAMRGMVAFAIVLCCLSYHGKVEGGHRKLSMKEDLEIDEKLKLLNKPGVKTIRTESGDIYDCIDFYKQPAFDHPLLKNHTYHYEMSPVSPNKRIADKEPSLIGKPLEIGLKGEGCPTGTVPIRRTIKEDLIRAKLFTEAYASRFNPLTVERKGLHHAIVQTKPDPAKKYNGAGTVISAYELNVTDSQYSSGQMTIRGGSDSIQVGWTVNPSLYGDTQSRLFTFLQAGSSSCFNTQCPGFIIVNNHIPLDLVISPISTRGGPTYGVNFFVYRDQFSGNWWLEVGKNYTQVGFWPQRIFSGLKDLATYVEWGGEAFSPLGQPGPGMGSGYFPTGETKYDAICGKMTTINEAHDPEDAENTQMFSDNNNYYKVDDLGMQREFYRCIMAFGGPGPS